MQSLCNCGPRLSDGYRIKASKVSFMNKKCDRESRGAWSQERDLYFECIR